MNCGRRLREWSAAGVWQRVFVHLLTCPRIAGRLQLADVLVDAGLVKAPLGGQKPGRIRPIVAAAAASTI